MDRDTRQIDDLNRYIKIQERLGHRSIAPSTPKAVALRDLESIWDTVIYLLRAQKVETLAALFQVTNLAERLNRGRTYRRGSFE